MTRKCLKLIGKALILAGCVWFTACRPLTGGLLSMCVVIKMTNNQY